MKKTFKPTQANLRKLKDCVFITASLTDHFGEDDSRQAIALMFRSPDGIVMLSGVVGNLEMEETE